MEKRRKTYKRDWARHKGYRLPDFAAASRSNSKCGKKALFFQGRSISRFLIFAIVSFLLLYYIELLLQHFHSPVDANGNEIGGFSQSLGNFLRAQLFDKPKVYCFP